MEKKTFTTQWKRNKVVKLWTSKCSNSEGKIVFNKGKGGCPNESDEVDFSLYLMKMFWSNEKVVFGHRFHDWFQVGKDHLVPHHI